MTDARASVGQGVRWSTIAVLGRELLRILFTVILARLLGPTAFGVVGQATVFIVVSTFLLDQGFAPALIQREHVDRRLAAAVTGVNLLSGVVLAGLTYGVAPLWADVFHNGLLTDVLRALGAGLLLKSLAIAPRALLTRDLRFKEISIAEILGAVVGGVCGVVAAGLGASYWSLVILTLVTDGVVLVVLLALRVGVFPSMRFSNLRGVVGFSVRAFIATFVNALARNVDTLLVSRYLGPTSLAYYSLAYRLLLVPVQFAGEPISNVLFSSFSRHQSDTAPVRQNLFRVTRDLAFAVLPVMGFALCAASFVVPLVFGDSWREAVPIVQILALTGGIQVVYSTNSAFLLSQGRAKENVRLAWATTVLVVIGVVAGLPFGVVGVAIGYSIGSLLRVPLVVLVQRRFVGWSVRKQVMAVLPGLVVTGSIVAVWWVSTVLLPPMYPLDDVVALLLAVLGGVTVLIAYRSVSKQVWRDLRAVVGGSR